MATADRISENYQRHALCRWAAMVAGMNAKNDTHSNNKDQNASKNTEKSTANDPSFRYLLTEMRELPMMDFNRLEFGEGVPHPLLSLVRRVVPGKRYVDEERGCLREICYKILQHGGREIMPVLVDQMNLANVMARDMWPICACMLNLIPDDDPKDMINAIDDDFGHSLFYWVVYMKEDFEELLHRFPALDLEANEEALYVAKDNVAYSLLRETQNIAVPPYVSGQRTILSLLFTHVFATAFLPPELVNLTITFLTNLPPKAKTISQKTGNVHFTPAVGSGVQD